MAGSMGWAMVGWGCLSHLLAFSTTCDRITIRQMPLRQKNARKCSFIETFSEITSEKERRAGKGSVRLGQVRVVGA